MLGIFLDTETNGLNPQKHKVIEIAYKILDVAAGKVHETFQSIVAQPLEVWQRSDPSSLKVNGFKWEEVSQGQKSDWVAKKIIDSFQKWGVKRGSAVFICQNPSFDRAFFSQLIDPDMQENLGWPYHWLDLASMFWAEKIRSRGEESSLLPWDTGFSKDRIAAACNLPPEGKPHRSISGVEHLLLCYEAIVGFPLRDCP